MVKSIKLHKCHIQMNCTEMSLQVSSGFSSLATTVKCKCTILRCLCKCLSVFRSLATNVTYKCLRNLATNMILQMSFILPQTSHTNLILQMFSVFRNLPQTSYTICLCKCLLCSGILPQMSHTYQYVPEYCHKRHIQMYYTNMSSMFRSIPAYITWKCTILI